MEEPPIRFSETASDAGEIGLDGDTFANHPICPSAVVAIPVRNEEDRIVGCLEALSRQIGCAAGSYGILLFLNNCTDATSGVVAGTIPNLTCPIRVVERTDQRASAGWARRQAMDLASAWLAESGGDGVILTTDADTRVGERWIAMNLAGLAAGVDAVAGSFVLDEVEAAMLPEALHRRGRLEARYETLLTELGARLDPEPHNPWPCHRIRSGATLAVKRSVYTNVGGMPELPLGEDQAFVDLLKSKDLLVRHDPAIVVVTSGRLDGRAVGGTADTMKMRCKQPASRCDERLERIDRALVRYAWRATLRRARATGRLKYPIAWARLLGLSNRELESLWRLGTFGQALATIEAASPRLVYRALRPSALPRQIIGARIALSIVRRIRR